MIVDEETAILIADDVPQMRRLLASYLGDMGYRRIDMAATGEEVVSAFQQQPYAIAFIDIEMPRMNGLSSLPELLAIAPDTHVVMVSSQGTLENVKTAVQRGAKGFLVKPFTKEKLADSLRHVKKKD